MRLAILILSIVGCTNGIPSSGIVRTHCPDRESCLERVKEICGSLKKGHIIGIDLADGWSYIQCSEGSREFSSGEGT